jgi:hypothetical protein
MPPKKKKGGQSREELERIQREQEERERLEALFRLEKQAEEQQAMENKKRDDAELLERKRLKKEAQMKLLAEKETMIATLSSQLNTLQGAFSAERNELESECRNKQQLCDALQNDLSALRSETDGTQRHLLEERDDVVLRAELLERQLAAANSDHTLAKSSATEADALSNTRISTLTSELNKMTEAKTTLERDTQYTIKNLEREVEKVTSVNRTLQDVIESREVDDRKNVTLMQLLNNQLDDTKRRGQELLDEERLRCKSLQKELAVLETANRQLSEEKAQLEREVTATRDQAERDVADYKAKVDQLKFDAKYLAADLHQYKTQLREVREEHAAAKTGAATTVQDAKLELDTQVKKSQELEALLHRKDREHFDKVTFLNAQISNNRTIISQLQLRLNKEREDRVTEVSAATTELDRKSNAVQGMHHDLEKKKAASDEIEMKLNADIAILKTTVFQLQSALVDRERELDSVSAAKDEEVTRLRSKLDEHFIPHRNDEEGTPANENSAQALTEKNERMQRELDASKKVSLETETRLKAQISNLNKTIDTQQSHLHGVNDDNDVEKAKQVQETTRLRQLLDTHHIPHDAAATA